MARISFFAPHYILGFILGMGFTFSSTGWTQTNETGTEEDPLEAFPWQTEGPGQLGARAKIAIPEGYRFLDGPNTTKLLQAMGNLTEGGELGLIGPDNLDWFVVYEFDDIGYVKDDDKDDLDTEDMLSQIRDSIDAGNEVRKERGLPTFQLEGWAIAPRYNDETKTLEWATRFQVEGRTSVNFKTRVLGRRGVMKVILATSPELLEPSLPLYREMMNGFEFTEGERYAEFKDGDRIAEIGLAALVVGGAGVVAAKTGLLAVILASFKKLGKFLIIAVVAVGAFLKRIFTGRKEE